MPLVDFEISDLCQNQQMIVPFDPDLVNPASLDVLIGETLLQETANGWAPIDLSVFSKDNPCYLEPKEFVLVETREVFNMPDNIAGEFRIKSSRAREGYNNLLAVWLDPGWHGSKLTLEIVNERCFSRLPIYPGLKIGQIVFHRCNIPSASYAKTGRYNNDKTVTASKG